MCVCVCMCTALALTHTHIHTHARTHSRTHARTNALGVCAHTQTNKHTSFIHTLPRIKYEKVFDQILSLVQIYIHIRKNLYTSCDDEIHACESSCGIVARSSCTHARTHTHTHARTHTRTHAHSHARSHARTHVNTCERIYIYILI